MLRQAYKRIWVPVFGRLLSFFIPILEGKSPKIKPTYNIDADNKINKNNYSGNFPP
tara:strand:- start:1786 stop:1953 length:168 start_codon:yes stop_codon:yes gene_type:complete